MGFDFGPLDFGKLSEKLERTSPRLAKHLSMKLLGLVSPFNSHLKGRMLEWTHLTATVEMPYRRSVKNHVGGIHAGALFTLGESCAGLIIVRNFSFKEFRPIMTDISVVYEKQARGKVRAVAKTTAATLSKIKKGLIKEAQLLPMETNIFNENDDLVAKVKTTWQIKSWSQVRKK